MMARVYASYQIVDELNKLLARDKDVKFYVSERRSSLSELKSKGIIDYARIDKNKVLHVYLNKNLDDLNESDWRSAISKLPDQLKSKMSGKDVEARYSWAKGKYLDLTELSGNIAPAWGETENDTPTSLRVAFDKVDKDGLNSLYDLKDDQDPSVARDGARTAHFIRYIKSGPTVVVPKQLWRNMGWSKIAIDNKVVVKYPTEGADILAILRPDFEKVVGLNGFTVTESATKMLNKPRRVFKDEVDPDKAKVRVLVKRFYATVQRAVMSTPEYTKAVDSAKQLIKNGKSTEADKLISTTWKKLFDDAISRRFKNDYQNLTKSYSSSDVSDHLSEYYAESVRENMEIIESKMIQIKKHPKYDYFTIKNVSGTPIPTY